MPKSMQETNIRPQCKGTDDWQVHFESTWLAKRIVEQGDSAQLISKHLFLAIWRKKHTRFDGFN